MMLNFDLDNSLENFPNLTNDVFTPNKTIKKYLDDGRINIENSIEHIITTINIIKPDLKEKFNNLLKERDLSIKNLDGTFYKFFNDEYKTIFSSIDKCNNFIEDKSIELKDEVVRIDKEISDKNDELNAITDDIGKKYIELKRGTTVSSSQDNNPKRKWYNGFGDTISNMFSSISNFLKKINYRLVLLIVLIEIVMFVINYLIYDDKVYFGAESIIRSVAGFSMLAISIFLFHIDLTNPKYDNRNPIYTFFGISMFLYLLYFFEFSIAPWINSDTINNNRLIYPGTIFVLFGLLYFIYYLVFLNNIKTNTKLNDENNTITPVNPIEGIDIDLKIKIDNLFSEISSLESKKNKFNLNKINELKNLTIKYKNDLDELKNTIDLRFKAIFDEASEEEKKYLKLHKNLDTDLKKITDTINTHIKRLKFDPKFQITIEHLLNYYNFTNFNYDNYKKLYQIS